jgi:hypothetical protein
METIVVFANRDEQSVKVTIHSQRNDRHVYNDISTNTVSLYDVVLKHKNKFNPFHNGNLFETPYYVRALPWSLFAQKR